MFNTPLSLSTTDYFLCLILNYLLFLVLFNVTYLYHLIKVLKLFFYLFLVIVFLSCGKTKR